jgi:hypothetical protein
LNLYDDDKLGNTTIYRRSYMDSSQ